MVFDVNIPPERHYKDFNEFLASVDFDATDVQAINFDSKKNSSLNLLSNDEYRQENYHFENLDGIERLVDLFSLDIGPSFDMKEFRFLESMPNLKQLALNYLERGHPIDFSRMKNLKNLAQLEIMETEMTNIQDISYLKSLRFLNLTAISFDKTIRQEGPLSPYALLEQPIIHQKLEQLSLKLVDLPDLDFLNEYGALRTLSLESCHFPERPDMRPLGEMPLSKSLNYLKIVNFPLDDLSFLQEFTSLSELHIGDNGYSFYMNSPTEDSQMAVRDIDALLSCKAVLNGSLKEITLPASVDFNNFFGDMRNTKTAFELRRRGIKLNLPPTFYDDRIPEIESQLYVFVGVPGAGKSVLGGFMNELGLEPLPKTCTRSLRPGEEKKYLRSVSHDEFESKYRGGRIPTAYDAFGHRYGVDFADLAEAYASNKSYFVDTSDVHAALALRDQFPGFVKVVLLLTPPELVEKGLAKRGETFLRAHADDHFRTNMTKITTLEKNYRKLRDYAPFADKLLDGNDYQTNIATMRNFVVRT